MIKYGETSLSSVIPKKFQSLTLLFLDIIISPLHLALKYEADNLRKVLSLPILIGLTKAYTANNEVFLRSNGN